ncbi:uncharacterized protein si:dkey-196h17.9 [Xyrauchen texanus]|uniref:uncharacterized protein si:dkey-196h17.9 n=1 Tax=Xyrauchen texanus TaxID=154827 RepID=UPI0022419BF4|nr:uncharacterized protein si:dkey-196h17.9 [Xyrauchen texanus]
MHEVQKICCEELHSFVQMYVHAEKKHIEKLQAPKPENSVYLFWLINTCRQLRFFATQINNLDIINGDDLKDTVILLKKMEDCVLSIVQKMMTHIAQDNLKSDLKKEVKHIHNLTEAILKQCASIPQTYMGKESQTIIVNIAYDCVSHVYLDCLMMIKFKRLKKRWGNVEERIKDNVLYFHNTFAEWNGPQNQLLKRMSEVLLHSDTEAMKLTCAGLFKDFPEDSKQYLPGLLRWKGVLSEQKVREVLDASQQACPNPGYVSQHPLMGLCCLRCE